MKNLSPKTKKILLIVLILVGIYLVYAFLKTKSTTSDSSTDTSGGTSASTLKSPNTWASGSPYGSQADMDATYAKYSVMDKEAAIAAYINQIKAYQPWYDNIANSVTSGQTVEQALRDAATYMLWVAGVPGF